MVYNTRQPQPAACGQTARNILFAFPALRPLPSSPPIGSLNDYLLFFWAEGIVALSLVAVVVCLYPPIEVARAAPGSDDFSRL